MNGAGRPEGRRPAPSYLLIANNDNGRMEVLTVERDGAKVLPVFGFEEEAELFLRLEASGGGWHVRHTSVGELISVLYGPCASVRSVALDPLPEILAKTGAAGMGMSRRGFVRFLTGETVFPEPWLKAAREERTIRLR